MKLNLKPVDIPFMVGDVVWVNQRCGQAHPQPYFQARIVQIILDGGLAHTSVIRQRRAVHELVISSATYDLKPMGDHEGMPRIILKVQFLPPEACLFSSREELLDYNNQDN
ncbi:hypothetical protein BH09BAC4_BH09BAC4_19830 [soil metagenome]